MDRLLVRLPTGEIAINDKLGASVNIDNSKNTED